MFDGSGADVIDLGSTITEPKLVVAISQGSSNFFAYEMGEDLVEDDLLVNEIAPSSGAYVMNLGQSDEGTRYIKVQADDAWHLEITSILEPRPWDGLAPLVGAGSDVVRYTGDGGILDYANTGNSNFFVYVH